MAQTILNRHELEAEACVQAGYAFDRERKLDYKQLVKTASEQYGEDFPAERFAAMIICELNRLYHLYA